MMRHLLALALAVCAIAGCAHVPADEVSTYTDFERVCGRWQLVTRDKVTGRRLQEVPFARRVLVAGKRELASSTDPKAFESAGAISFVRCYEGYPSP